MDKRVNVDLSIKTGTPKPKPTEFNFKRLDLGMPVPDDGKQYFMIKHELPLLGYTRFQENKPNDRASRPAIVNANWGIKTQASFNGDYVETTPEWQEWLKQFWNHHSGNILPEGVKTGTYTLPKNSKDVIYWSYTSGSLMELYSLIIRDSGGWTDGNGNAPETGGKCVVQKRNMDARRYWKLLNRCTTGTIVSGFRNGSKLIAEAIDSLISPPSDIAGLPMHLYYFATQVNYKDGSVTRFPYVKNSFAVHGFPPAGTAMPLLAPGGYFELNYSAVELLSPGQIWKPYWSP